MLSDGDDGGDNVPIMAKMIQDSQKHDYCKNTITGQLSRHGPPAGTGTEAVSAETKSKIFDVGLE